MYLFLFKVKQSLRFVYGYSIVAARSTDRAYKLLCAEWEGEGLENFDPTPTRIGIAFDDAEEGEIESELTGE